MCRHSTGRGGLANLTGVHSPPPDAPAHIPQEWEYSGRGGAGNIRSRSSSRDPLARIWHKVAHPLPHHIREHDEQSGSPTSTVFSSVNGGNPGELGVASGAGGE